MKFLVILGAVLAVASAQLQYQQRYNSQLAYNTPRPLALAPRPNVGAIPISRNNGAEASAQILRYDNDIDPTGAFQYSYETSNGIAAAAQGTPRNFGGNPPLIPVVITGSYAYTSPEGLPVSISYTADENGYHPQGDLLPTPPPIPPQIARALEYIARTNGQKK